MLPEESISGDRLKPSIKNGAPQRQATKERKTARVLGICTSTFTAQLRKCFQSVGRVKGIEPIDASMLVTRSWLHGVTVPPALLLDLYQYARVTGSTLPRAVNLATAEPGSASSSTCAQPSESPPRNRPWTAPPSASGGPATALPALLTMRRMWRPSARSGTELAEISTKRPESKNHRGAMDLSV